VEVTEQEVLAKVMGRKVERERESGEVVRDTTLETISSVLKVPSQCPLILLV
jgi:hypothetical protein